MKAGIIKIIPDLVETSDFKKCFKFGFLLILVILPWQLLNRPGRKFCVSTGKWGQEPPRSRGSWFGVSSPYGEGRGLWAGPLLCWRGKAITQEGWMEIRESSASLKHCFPHSLPKIGFALEYARVHSDRSPTAVTLLTL